MVESGADVLDRFRSATAQRREVLTAVSDDDWNAPTMTPAGPDSYGRFMRIRIFDCWMYEQDIREALSLSASDEELGVPAAHLALDEMAGGMGFVVGKLGKAPDGSRVAIELTGPLSRTIRVYVDGRAAVVNDFGDAVPTKVIRLDGFQFTRVCGGRTGAKADVEFEGDAEAGQRIVDNLAYVI